MASISQMADDIFTCTLCLEKVREPRTLPCLHAFCRYCLSAYVRQTVKDWVFPCPLCGQKIKPISKGLSVDQWLETFPSSNFLAQLTRIQQARQAERACDICRQEQVLVEAVAWCRTCMESLCPDCQRVHTRSRASRDHPLISMDSLVNEPLEKLVGSGSGGEAAVCPEHKGKTATLVCLDCKKLVCETCIALTHSACRRMEQVEKVAPMLRRDMVGAKQHLETHARAANSVADHIEDQLQQLTRSRESAVEEVEGVKRQLLDLVEARAAKVLVDLDSAYSRQRELFMQRAGQSRATGKALSRSARFLEHLLTYGNEEDVLSNYDSIVQQARVVDGQVAVLKQGNDPMTLKFTPDKKATDTLRALVSLGDVKVVKSSGRVKDTPKEGKSSKVGNGDDTSRTVPAAAGPRMSPRRMSSFGKSPRTTSSRTSKAKITANFSARTKNDTMRTDLRAVVCLRSGDIIVMDVHFRNKRLKKFTPRGKIISMIDTGECPYGMALIQDTDLVVTHPRSREFVFVTAGGTLQVTGRIKTNKSYYSMASSSTDGVFAAMGSNPPDANSIDIISFEGEVLNTISLDRVRFPSPPKDISLPPTGDVLLLFGGKETLVCMAYDGTVKYAFQTSQQHDVKKPTSVASDQHGNAYIADVDGNAVHVITNEGKYMGELLTRHDGVREPLALHLTDEGQAVVTQTNGDVKVFLVSL